MSTTNALYIGWNNAANGNGVTVCGAGSKLTTNTYLFVGLSGSNNNLTVSSGGVVESLFSGDVGAYSTGNTATVTGAGSQWIGHDQIAVGDQAGADGNSLLVTGGGSVSTSSNIFIGNTAPTTR
jgi:T5SS/PEP-CTERM-associated repeat protein